jgi:hypothetical protein
MQKVVGTGDGAIALTAPGSTKMKGLLVAAAPRHCMNLKRKKKTADKIAIILNFRRRTANRVSLSYLL